MKKILKEVGRILKSVLPFAIVANENKNIMSSVLTYPSVRAAVNAGHKFVIVSTGVYHDDGFSNKNDIMVLGGDSSVFTTTGQSTDAAFKMENASNCIIMGIHIHVPSNGQSNNADGIYMDSSCVNNTIMFGRLTSADRYGVFLDGSPGNYTNNILLGNYFTTAYDVYSEYGGGNPPNAVHDIATVRSQQGRVIAVGNCMQPGTTNSGYEADAGGVNNIVVGNMSHSINLNTGADNNLVCYNSFYDIPNHANNGTNNTFSQMESM